MFETTRIRLALALMVVVDGSWSAVDAQQGAPPGLPADPSIYRQGAGPFDLKAQITANYNWVEITHAVARGGF